MMIQSEEIRKIGNNVEALRERIKNVWYTTFKNGNGEPLLIFSQAEAGITRITSLQDNTQQLLFRTHIKYYILTFSSSDEAKKFGDYLLRCIRKMYMRYVPGDIKDRFEKNRIKIDRQNF